MAGGDHLVQMLLTYPSVKCLGTFSDPGINKIGDQAMIESHDRYTLVYPRFSDFDLQGILNSRQYIDLVSEARIEQMRRHYQLPMEEYAHRSQSWVLSHFSIDFIKPIVFGVNFFVQTTVKSVEDDCAVVAFVFVDITKSKLFSQGEVHYHLIDLKTRKPVSIPEEEKNRYLSM